VKYIPGIFKVKSTHPVTLIIIGVLAAVALAVFIWTGTISLKAYKMTIVAEEHTQGQLSGYYDLDNNGESEFLVLKTYGSEFPAVEYYEGRDKFIDVLRPYGTWFNDFPSFCFGDFDKDTLKELYLFTISNDSVLLNAYEPMGDNGHFIRNMYIDDIEEREGKRDLTLEGTYFQDDNKDGSQELVFLLRAGFSRSPRRLYEVDIVNQTLFRSENYAGGFQELLPVDLDQDGMMEFIAPANAIENFPLEDSSKKYNDNSAWCIAFANDLQDVVFDLEFTENKPYVQCCQLEDDSGQVLILMVSEHNKNRLHLMKYSFQGVLLAQKEIYQETYLRMLNKPDNNSKNIVLTDMDNLFCYDSDFNLVETKESYGIPCTLLDFFGFKELTDFQIFKKGHQVILSDRNLEVQGRIHLRDHSVSKFISVSVISKESDDSFVCCLSTQLDGDFIIKVEKRKFEHIGIHFNVLLYFLFFAFFYGIFRIQFFFFNQRIISEQKIHSLQLQSVQNQLQPHFTFNVLNTIGSLIYKNEKETAYEYLNYFSDMLRSTLVSGKQTDWMLDEELRFIETFVAMENLRFDNRFNFILNISSETDISFMIPKLMVQTYVENAISHGLMHKKDDCTLKVNMDTDDSHVVIVVEDNGVGRLASEKLQKDNGGHGNEILNNYMELYNRINKTKFVFTVTDLFNDAGNASGTRISLLIPKDYSKNIMLR